MEYVQERVTTLHDLTGHVPDAPTDRAAVVVPMTEREYGGLAAEHTLSELETVDPAQVVVPLRAPRDRVDDFRNWLSGFDLSLEVLWCNAPGVEELLDDRLPDRAATTLAGKGRDVWLALGIAAADNDYVVLHDADARSYSASDVPRLLAPLDRGYGFSKGYYSRVENDRLYGRLCRLFYEPLVRAMAAENDTDVLSYLSSFRYALAGEFAMTADLASDLRIHQRWGLEVGTLGEMYRQCGFDGTAQVDLGNHQHDHRAVSGPDGLSDMSQHVGHAIFRVAESNGVRPDYDTLPNRYQSTAQSLIRQYADDAVINGLSYDIESERAQVETYAETISPPGRDNRLPAWSETSFTPDELRTASLIDHAPSGKQHSK